MATRSSIGARSSDRSRAPTVGRAFFDRSAIRVARALLGCVLEVHAPDGIRSARLVETEAYPRGDPASHAFRGPTRRNRSMYGRPGTVYVFRIHQVVCANFVTRLGEGVLLRAGEVAGGAPGDGQGPGRLCRALGITLADDGIDAVDGERIRVRAAAFRGDRIAVGPRIGIRLAAARPLRFWIASSRSVSRPRGLSAEASPTRSRADARSLRTRRTSRRASAGGRSGGRSDGR
jgi:DNA-3-methyladenine glycosylase